MLKIRGRILKLQKVFGVSDSELPVEHRIRFIDSEGRADPQQLLISEGRLEWIDGDASEWKGQQ